MRTGTHTQIQKSKQNVDSSAINTTSTVAAANPIFTPDLSVVSGGNEVEDVGGSEFDGCVVVDGVAEGEVAGASVGGGLASVGDGEVVVGS